MRFLLTLLAPALLLLAFSSAHAQVSLDLSIKRRFYMIHEPLMATVTINNTSGRDLTLQDTPEGVQWFSFSIVGSDGRAVPPRKTDYKLEPLEIRAGATVKRTVNLNELYQMGDFGFFKVKANIHIISADKYFTSAAVPIEMTAGRQRWKQTVGVPEGQDGAGAIRTWTLLSHGQATGQMLYAQVAGDEDGVIYGCYALGRCVDGYEPDAKLDSGNNLAVLQLVGQKTYLLTRISVSGAFLGQSTYTGIKGRPHLQKLPDGTLRIVGAIREEQLTAAAKRAAPKISDRPPGMPATTRVAP